VFRRDFRLLPPGLKAAVNEYDVEKTIIMIFERRWTASGRQALQQIEQDAGE
jgi:hypothetical protein